MRALEVQIEAIRGSPLFHKPGSLQDLVLKGLSVRDDAGISEFARQFFAICTSVDWDIRDAWIDKHIPWLHRQSFSYQQVRDAIHIDPSVRNVTNAAVVDEVRSRALDNEETSVLLMGAGTGVDRAEFLKLLDEQRTDMADCPVRVTVTAVDLIPWPHADPSVVRVRKSGVEDIPKQSQVVISCPWVNGLQPDKNRAQFIWELVLRLKPGGVIVMAEHSNTPRLKNAQAAAFFYFSQIAHENPGSCVERIESVISDTCPYACSMIKFRAPDSEPVQCALPTRRTGRKVQLMKHHQAQDGRCVSGGVLLDVELPAFQKTVRLAWAGVYMVVTKEGMAYIGSSRDIWKRIISEHVNGQGGCPALRGLTEGHFMVLFSLQDLCSETLGILEHDISLGLLDLILQRAEQIAIIARKSVSPLTTLNVLTCTFGHVRYRRTARGSALTCSIY